MNANLIVESVSASYVQSDISRSSKMALDMAMKDDAQFLIESIIESAELLTESDEGGNKQGKLAGFIQKLKDIWKVAVEFFTNMAKNILLNIQSKIGMYDKMAARAEDIKKGYAKIKSKSIENFHVFPKQLDVDPATVINGCVKSKTGKDATSDDIELDENQIKEIEEDIAKAFTKSGVADGVLNEAPAAKTVSDVSVDTIIDVLKNNKKTIQTVTNATSSFKGIKVTFKGAIPTVKTKMSILKLGTKCLSKYIKMVVQRLKESYSLAKMCVSAE